MCGAFGPFLFGSYWWIFPLLGMLICLGFLIFLARFASTGRGCMWMGGHHGAPKHQVAEMGDYPWMLGG
jgi:hypothetical protein